MLLELERDSLEVGSCPEDVPGGSSLEVGTCPEEVPGRESVTVPAAEEFPVEEGLLSKVVVAGAEGVEEESPQPVKAASAKSPPKETKLDVLMAPTYI